MLEIEKSYKILLEEKKHKEHKSGKKRDNEETSEESDQEGAGKSTKKRKLIQNMIREELKNMTVTALQNEEGTTSQNTQSSLLEPLSIPYTEHPTTLEKEVNTTQKNEGSMSNKQSANLDTSTVPKKWYYIGPI